MAHVGRHNRVKNFRPPRRHRRLHLRRINRNQIFFTKRVTVSKRPNRVDATKIKSRTRLTAVTTRVRRRRVVPLNLLRRITVGNHRGSQPHHHLVNGNRRVLKHGTGPVSGRLPLRFRVNRATLWDGVLDQGQVSHPLEVLISTRRRD